jgi:hypothetical protein
MDRLAEILDEWRAVERAAVARSATPDDRVKLRRRSAWLRSEYLAALDGTPAGGRDNHRDAELDRQLVDASNGTAATAAELSVLVGELGSIDDGDARSGQVMASIERAAADLVRDAHDQQILGSQREASGTTVDAIARRLDASESEPRQ